MTESNPDGRYDADLGVYRYAPDPEEAASTAVVLGVAEVTNTEVSELPPLNSALDPDALDQLFVSTRTGVRVEFEYSECLVAVEGGPEVTITPPDERRRIGPGK